MSEYRVSAGSRWKSRLGSLSSNIEPSIDGLPQNAQPTGVVPGFAPNERRTGTKQLKYLLFRFCSHGRRALRLPAGVAHPGANYASLAAEPLALLAGNILRACQRGRLRPASRTAGVFRIDGKRRAGLAEARHHLAIRALALGAGAHRRGFGRCIVRRVAIGAAAPGRERTGRMALHRDKNRKRGEARRQERRTHENPPAPRDGKLSRKP